MENDLFLRLPGPEKAKFHICSRVENGNEDKELISLQTTDKSISKLSFYEALTEKLLPLFYHFSDPT